MPSKDFELAEVLLLCMPIAKNLHPFKLAEVLLLYMLSSILPAVRLTMCIKVSRIFPRRILIVSMDV